MILVIRLKAHSLHKQNLDPTDSYCQEPCEHPKPINITNNESTSVAKESVHRCSQHLRGGRRGWWEPSDHRPGGPTSSALRGYHISKAGGLRGRSGSFSRYVCSLRLGVYICKQKSACINIYGKREREREKERARDRKRERETERERESKRESKQERATNVCVCVCRSVGRSVGLSVCMSVCLSVCLSVCTRIHICTLYTQNICVHKDMYTMCTVRVYIYMYIFLHTCILTSALGTRC